PDIFGIDLFYKNYQVLCITFNLWSYTDRKSPKNPKSHFSIY
ncbi:unnamed protein product, partial [marine sediment metagenome]